MRLFPNTKGEPLCSKGYAQTPAELLIGQMALGTVNLCRILLAKDKLQVRPFSDTKKKDHSFKMTNQALADCPPHHAPSSEGIAVQSRLLAKLGPPVVPFHLFLRRVPLLKIDYRKKGTLILTSHVPCRIT